MRVGFPPAYNMLTECPRNVQLTLTLNKTSKSPECSLIVEKITSILPSRRPIEHHEPFLRHEYVDLKSQFGGNYVARFRDFLHDHFGVCGCVVTNSGTSALTVALKACGVREGDEVLVPSATFVATANAVSHIGAIPVFIDGVTLTPDNIKAWLETKTRPYYSSTRRFPGRFNPWSGATVAAVVPVHLFGHPCDMDGITKVAKEYGLAVVEDACQGFGSSIDLKPVGTFGDMGCFSFNRNKIITTDGGGCIVSNDPWLISVADGLATTARETHPWHISHYDIGWNFRMGQVNAALGCTQIEGFHDTTLPFKRTLATKYRIALRDIVEFYEPERGESNYWLNVILTDNRDELLEVLYKQGIHARASFTPIHQLKPYINHQRSSETMPESEEFFRRAVCLPSGNL